MGQWVVIIAGWYKASAPQNFVVGVRSKYEQWRRGRKPGIDTRQERAFARAKASATGMIERCMERRLPTQTGREERVRPNNSSVASNASTMTHTIICAGTPPTSWRLATSPSGSRPSRASRRISSSANPRQMNPTIHIKPAPSKFRDQTPRCLSCYHSDRVEVKTYRSEIPASLVQDGAESAVESAYVERFSQHDSTDDAVQSDSIRVATYEHDRKTRPPSLSKSRHLGAVHSGH